MTCVMIWSLKIVWKIKNVLIKQNTSFLFLNKNTYFFILGKVSFKIPKNAIASAFFSAEAKTKKRNYALAKLMTDKMDFQSHSCSKNN